MLSSSYAGVGPVAHPRSDASLVDDVQHVLTHSPEVGAGDVEVRVEAGEVTLSGSVEDHAARRRIEDLVVAVSGVRVVSNHLRVRRPES
ncbi:BON domain-containing protein [Nannocystis exedens]|uniref:BON domain-containing protein n=1 Tax=Nannocystis exedens TaxID=54 RepID=A0A1I2GQE9_9BACT|nr:BON domain-containing protein [Nannocystis exedens]SFF19692.1 BON domain-containing protein [Nannocystis exedens]